MRTLRELTRRVQALEGGQTEPVVVLLRSFAELPTAIVGPGLSWQRRPDEPIEQLRARAFADAACLGPGVHVLREMPRGVDVSHGGL